MPLFSFWSSSKPDDIPGIVFEPPAPTIRQTAEEWRMKLAPETFKTCIEHKDEQIWHGKLNGGDWYGCAACASPLFSPKAYNPEGGTGWPTFNEPMEGTIRYVRDKDVGQTARTVKGKSRVEIRCKACEAYLGHVSYNGPFQTWPYTYSVNSTAVKGYNGPVPAIKRPAHDPNRRNSLDNTPGQLTSNDFQRSYSVDVQRRRTVMPSPKTAPQTPNMVPQSPHSFHPQSPYSQPGASPMSMRSPMGGAPSPMIGATPFSGQWGQEVPGMQHSARQSTDQRSSQDNTQKPPRPGPQRGFSGIF